MPPEPLVILKTYIEKMPTFSPATAKIVQLTSNLNTPAGEIVKAIRMDPILTGKVLQLVNSAYFSLAQKVTSLNRALVYLGINTIKNLALSTAVMQTFETKNAELAELVRPVWRHSLASAVCAKMIVQLTDVPKSMVEEYFIAGLLHDIGKIILMQAFYGTSRHDGHLTLAEEKERYGLTHAEIGSVILKSWHFPDALIQAVKAHHQPIPGNKLSYFLQLADAMTYRFNLNLTTSELAKRPPEQAPDSRPLADDVWQVLGITEEKLVKEMATAAEHIEKAEVFLNISSSKEKVVELE